MFKTIIILYHYFLAKRRLKMSRHQIDRLHAKRLKIITDYARQRSPFYRKHVGEVITKKQMMEYFSFFNTRGIAKEKAFSIALEAEKSRDFKAMIGDVTVGLSSGTSGNRGLFLVSEQERLAWCGNILAKVLPSTPWKKQKIAFFLRTNSNLYETIHSQTLSFAFFDLLDDVTILREKLTEFDPDILVAPPSMLLMLKGSCQPNKVVSVAETLFASDEKLLETAFKQKIFQIYQCTEGFLAFTCNHGTLHINEDLVMIEKEYLDEKRFIPIVTDLFRKTQPIIRYRLDDVLVEKKGICPCGCVFQALERIEGRCDDLLYVAMPNGKTKPLFPDFISRRISAASEKIEEYEVVQSRVDQWQIYIQPVFYDVVKKGLQDLFNELGCLSPEIIFVSTGFPKVPGAKLRRIRRSYEAV